MQKMLIIILFLFLGCAKQNPTVTFNITAEDVNPEDTIYVAGNHPQLGNWNPRGFMLRKEGEVSTGTINVSPGTRLEFKITRGSWAREALNDDGTIRTNSHILVNSDTIVTIHIKKWKDHFMGPEGGITGIVRYHKDLTWPGLKPRDIIVWLPPSYEKDSEKRYPILYMHDGQNIIDPNTSFLGIDWQVDEVSDSLIKAGKMEEIIIVGVYNTADRRDEYSLSNLGEKYMEFLVRKVKPMVDSLYRTMPDKEHTAVMGSSMGGLISFLLAWKYPNVFHYAGCLSPAFIYNNGKSIHMVNEHKEQIPDIKLYIDNGTEGLESQLQPGCDYMLPLLREKSFKDGENLMWYLDRGAEHNEAAWAKRVWRPLLFFFGK
ncbi:MAG: alpha/beta hydrolase-fold protein [Calditrichia bacterium]